MEKVALVLLRARLKDEVEEELTRGARRGLGERLLESSSRIRKTKTQLTPNIDKTF